MKSVISLVSMSAKPSSLMSTCLVLITLSACQDKGRGPDSPSSPPPAQPSSPASPKAPTQSAPQNTPAPTTEPKIGVPSAPKPKAVSNFGTQNSAQASATKAAELSARQTTGRAGAIGLKLAPSAEGSSQSGSAAAPIDTSPQVQTEPVEPQPFVVLLLGRVNGQDLRVLTEAMKKLNRNASYMGNSWLSESPVERSINIVQVRDTFLVQMTEPEMRQIKSQSEAIPGLRLIYRPVETAQATLTLVVRNLSDNDRGEQLANSEFSPARHRPQSGLTLPRARVP